MRFVFKTSYDADINWFKHKTQAFWYFLLFGLMMAIPLYFHFLSDPYLLGEITSVMIFAIAAMGRSERSVAKFSAWLAEHGKLATGGDKAQ